MKPFRDHGRAATRLGAVFCALAAVATAGCANDALITRPDADAGAPSTGETSGSSSGSSVGASSGSSGSSASSGSVGDSGAPGSGGGRGSGDGGAASDATVGTDGAVGCSGAAPPSQGLAIWLRAGVGYTADSSGNVSMWADQAGGSPAKTPSDIQRPTLVPKGLNGVTTLHFEGAPDDAHQQALERSVPIQGLEEMSIVFVNATPILWKDDPGEWCHWKGCASDHSQGPGVRAVSETGCSGTYQHVLWWNGAPDPNKPGSALDWSGVFLTPKQEGIGFRFGNLVETYSDNPCSVVHDDHVEWPRPSSIGTNWTMTESVHDHTMNTIYVDGKMAFQLPVPGGTDSKVYADDTLDVGNGFGWVDGHNHGGDVAEVLVYTRALPDADRQQVEHYLDCTLFPSHL